MSVTDLLEEALQLSPESRVALAEKIVESLGSQIDSSIERSHLEAVADRRERTRTHADSLLDGHKALAEARSHLAE